MTKEDSEQMGQEVKKYNAEEEKQWDKVSSKNSLKLFAINIKAIAEDEELQLRSRVNRRFLTTVMKSSPGLIKIREGRI